MGMDLQIKSQAVREMIEVERTECTLESLKVELTVSVCIR